MTINQGSSSVSTTIYDSTGGPVTGTLGEQVYDTATVTGTPVHADGDGDLLLLQHGEPVYGTTTPVGSTADGDAEANGSVPELGDNGGIDGGQRRVHRRVQRRQQLQRLRRVRSSR